MADWLSHLAGWLDGWMAGWLADLAIALARRRALDALDADHDGGAVR